MNGSAPDRYTSSKNSPFLHRSAASQDTPQRNAPPDPFVHCIEFIPVPELDEELPLCLGQGEKVHPSDLVDG